MTERPVPDGGWGWVIVACSFLYHLCGVGLVYSLSVLYVSWVEDFETGRGITAWVLTLTITMCVAFGPFVAALGARFSYRVVTIVGGIALGLGFFLSYFATSVYHLIITIGLISGAGMGLTYLPAIAIIPSYFDKKRAIAVGIGASGVGVGAFIMPPLVTWLDSVYTWRGTMLIVSGITLNICVLGALMRPVEYPQHTKTIIIEEGDILKSTNDFHNDKEDGDVSHTGSRHLEQEHLFLEDGHLPHICKSISPHSSLHSISSSITEQSQRPCDHYNGGPLCRYDPGTEKSSCQCHAHLDRVIQQSASHENNSLISSGYRNNDTGEHDVCHSMSHQLRSGHLHTCVKNGILSPTTKFHSGLLSIDLERKGLLNRRHLPNSKPDALRGLGGSVQHIGTRQHPISFSSVHELRRPPSKLSVIKTPEIIIPNRNRLANSYKDVMLSGSIYNVLLLDTHPAPAPSINSKLSASIAIQDPILEDAQITDIEIISSGDFELEPQEEATVSKNIYLTLLSNPGFLIMAFSNLLINLTYLMPVLYIVDRAVDNGVDRTSASLALSLYGAGNLFGRIFMGLIADRSFVDALVLYIVCLSACGMATCVSPVCGSSMVLHGLYGLVFGTFIGGYVTLTPVVLVELLGADLVGQSYGLILAFQSVATLLGTPLAGWMFDWTSSYTIAFIIHGIFLLAAALLMLILKLMLRRKMRQSKADDDTDGIS